jgi:hypothetical protein
MHLFQEEAVCKWCDELFIRGIRKDASQFCSQKCRARFDYYDRKERGLIKYKEYKPKPKHRRKCVQCKCEFLGRPNSKYCSRACGNRAFHKQRMVDGRQAAINEARRIKGLNKNCMECGKFLPHGGIFCTACRRQTPTSKLTLEQRVAIFWRDDWICQLCKVEIDQRLIGTGLPLSPSIDHRFPRVFGGEDTVDNCQAAHLECNRRKGARIGT